jgi:cytochrome c peroxidase
MRASAWFGALLALTAACQRVELEPVAARDPVAESTRVAHLAQLDSIRAALAVVDSTIAGGAPDRQVQRAFHEARRHYKHAEFLVEYFTPTAAKQLNGPAIDEVEEDDPNATVQPAEGFQVLEELLFPASDSTTRHEARNQLGIMQAVLHRVRSLTEAAAFTDAQLFDAMRLEIARVSTLGLAAFDSPVALASEPEMAAALEGVREAVRRFGSSSEAGVLDARLAAAIAHADSAGDFTAFDRLGYLRHHLRPIALALHQLRLVRGLELPDERRAWRGEVPSLFDPGAFDVAFFAALDAPAPTAERTALGRRLFHEPALSGTGQRSCASCHVPSLAFTDGKTRATALKAERSGPALRNTPTVINAGLQTGSFYDLRTTFLEDQVGAVISSPAEMHGSLQAAAEVIGREPVYRQAFAAAFNRGPEQPIDPREIREALAEYLRSLQSLDSRFDRHVRGDSTALTIAEQRGFNLFMGKARCGTCHFVPLFNGTVPPGYARSDVEIIGVPERIGPGAPVDRDQGRGPLHGNPLHAHAFRTTSVRNVALTAPYMHNGVYRTLEEVVDFYDGGGGAGLGIRLDNQTLPPDSLHLTPTEKLDLVAFMRALTDTTGLTR